MNLAFLHEWTFYNLFLQTFKKKNVRPVFMIRSKINGYWLFTVLLCVCVCEPYFVSSVLRNRLCTSVLSSAVGATLSKDAVLNSTRLVLLAEN